MVFIANKEPFVTIVGHLSCFLPFFEQGVKFLLMFEEFSRSAAPIKRFWPRLTAKLKKMSCVVCFAWWRFSSTHVDMHFWRYVQCLKGKGLCFSNQGHLSLKSYEAVLMPITKQPITFQNVNDDALKPCRSLTNQVSDTPINKMKSIE